jgi:hypothetical protein
MSFLVSDIEIIQISAFSSASYSRINPSFNCWKANLEFKIVRNLRHRKTTIFTSIVYGAARLMDFPRFLFSFL